MALYKVGIAHLACPFQRQAEKLMLYQSSLAYIEYVNIVGLGGHTNQVVGRYSEQGLVSFVRQYYFVNLFVFFCFCQVAGNVPEGI